MEHIMATTKRTTTKTTTSSGSAGSKARSSGGRHSPAKSADSQSKPLSRTTTDHDEIRKWAEERGGQPACVRGTGGKGDVGMLRLDFPGYSEDQLQPIEWDEFFEKFDERELALVYQEKTAGGARSNFNKLISRDTTAGKPKTRAAR